MKFLFTLATLVVAASASGAVHSGQATAELMVASNTYEPSKPVEAAIRLTVDSGWHTYWINPGEGGMKLSIDWTLPEGWHAGPLHWPVPEKIKTGTLPGFGYTGEILLPVTLTPPAGASGAVTVGVKLGWLTCNEEACVPGEAPLTLSLKPGEPVPTPAAPIISKALESTPQPLAGLSLKLKDDGGKLILTLEAPAGCDPGAFEVFPATPDIVDNAASIHFTKSGNAWTTSVPKSDSIKDEPKVLELVLAGGGLPHPAVVSWSRK